MKNTTLVLSAWIVVVLGLHFAFGGINTDTANFEGSSQALQPILSVVMDTANQANIANNTLTKVLYNTVISDPYSGWDGNHTFTTPIAGSYTVHFQSRMSSLTSGKTVYFDVYAGGGSTPTYMRRRAYVCANSGGNVTCTVGVTFSCPAGAEIYSAMQHNNGDNVPDINWEGTCMSITYKGK